MLEIRQTAAYSEWFESLRDRAAKTRIDIRIRRLSLGNFGDANPIGEGVSELRVHFGPGYRLYFTQRGKEIVILLVGGDRSSQDHDIKLAKMLANQL